MPEEVPSTGVVTPDQAISNDPQIKKKKKKRRGGNVKDNVLLKSTSKFDGETEKMNGHIFSTPEESNDPMEYIRTAEMAERYLNKEYDIVEMSSIFDDPPTPPTIVAPTVIDATSTDKLAKDLYPLRLKAYLSREYELQTAMRSFWSVIWGQCTQALIVKLEDNVNMKTWKKDGKVIELLECIQKICLDYDTKVSPYITMHKHLAAFYNYKQKETDNVHQYLELFKHLVQNINRYGGSVGKHPVFIKEFMIKGGELAKGSNKKDFETAYAALDEDRKATFSKMSEDKALATAFMMGSNRKIFGPMLVNMQNQFLLGNDQMPDTLAQAYSIMANYNPPATSVSQNSTISPEVSQRSVYSLGMSFFQADEPSNKPTKDNTTKEKDKKIKHSFSSADPYRKGKGHSDPDDLVPGVDGLLYKNIRCFRCNHYGHYPNRCGVCLFQLDKEESSDDDTEESMSDALGSLNFSFFQSGLSFMTDTNNNKFRGLKPTWILLDTQSTVDIFHNPGLLTDIKSVDGPGMRIKSNGNGSIISHEMGNVAGYGDVWYYHPDSIANILSVANVRKKFEVPMDTGPGDPCPSICIHRPNGGVIRFKEHKMGLYVYDAGKSDETKPNSNDTNDINLSLYSYSFVNTVEDNENNFTSRQISLAKQALELYRKLGRPSETDFIRYLDSNFIRNCPFSSEDAKRAFHIYGKDPAFIQGKTKRQKPKSMPHIVLTSVPQSIIDHHKNVELGVDIFYINGCMFLHTISRNIKFRTLEQINNGSYNTMLNAVQTVFNLYESRGFSIDQLRGDGQFECLRESIRPTHLHTAAVGEHVPDVERSIQTIEDDCRAIYHGLPYRLYPKLMLTALANTSVQNRNLFPQKDGVSNTIGCTTMMTGLPFPDVSYFALEFGTYVQAHDHPTITNNLNPSRASPAIALGPANRNGGYYFMSLSTGKRILRYKWDVLPISKIIIDIVHQLALHEMKKAKRERYQSLTFEWSLGNDIIYPSSSENVAQDDTNMNADETVIEDNADDIIEDDNNETANEEDDINSDDNNLINVELDQDERNLNDAATENIHDDIDTIDRLTEQFNADSADMDRQLQALLPNDEYFEPVQEERSVKHPISNPTPDSNSNHENRSVEHPITTSYTSNTYNLRSNPTRTSTRDFESEHYRYSFLQHAMKDAKNIVSEVEQLDDDINDDSRFDLENV